MTDEIGVKVRADSSQVEPEMDKAAESVSAAKEKMVDDFKELKQEFEKGLHVDTSSLDGLGAKVQPQMDAASASVDHAKSQMVGDFQELKQELGKDIQTPGLDTLGDGVGPNMQEAANEVSKAKAKMTADFAALKASFGQGLAIDTQNLDELQKHGAQVFLSTRTNAERLKEGIAELNKLHKAGAIDAETHARAVQQLNNSLGSTANQTGPMAMAMGQIKSMFGWLAILAAAKQGIQVAAGFEQMQVSLNSVMGSAAEGEKAFSWIKQFATDTPYEVGQVASSFQLLKAYGIDPMNGSLRAIADMSAFTGKGFQGMQSATMALGQAWSLSKLQGDNIRQMIEAGVPVWDLLAKATGKNAGELQKMTEKGQLGRREISLLMNEMAKMGAGASAAQMDTLTGKMSNFSDSIQNAIDNMRRAGAFDGLKEGLEMLTGLVPSVGETFQALGEVVGSLLSIFSTVWNGITSLMSDGAGQTVTISSIIRGALETIRIAAIFLKLGFETSFTSIQGFLMNTMSWLNRFASVAKAAFNLDWDGVKAAWKAGAAESEGILEQTTAKIIKLGNKAREDILKFSAFSPQQTVGLKATSGVTEYKPKKGEESAAKEKKAPSRVSSWEDDLAQAKLALQEKSNAEGTFHEMSKAEELAYWSFILAEREKTAEEEIAVRRKVAQLTTGLNKESFDLEMAKLKQMEDETGRNSEAKLAIIQKEAALTIQKYGEMSAEGVAATQRVTQATREAAAQKAAIEASAAQLRTARAMASIDESEAEAQMAVEMGAMSNERMLTLQLEYEERRYQIRASALEAQKALIDPNRDPVALAEANNQLQVQEMEHQSKMASIRRQVILLNIKEQEEMWTSLSDRMGSLWDKGINAMMNGTLTLKNSMKAIYTEMGAWFVKDVVGKQVKSWLLGESAKTGATQVGTASRLMMETMAAAKSVALWAAAAVKNILAAAWEAMAGAYKAIVSIPYVGPFLAPAMAAGAFVAVAGMASNVMSAAGGYDIPSSVNPLVQAHAREMILPAKYADVVRSVADGGGATSGRSFSPSFTIHAMDSKDVIRSLKSGGALRKVMTGLQRDFAGVGKD